MPDDNYLDPSEFSYDDPSGGGGVPWWDDPSVYDENGSFLGSYDDNGNYVPGIYDGADGKSGHWYDNFSFGGDSGGKGAGGLLGKVLGQPGAAAAGIGGLFALIAGLLKPHQKSFAGTSADPVAMLTKANAEHDNLVNRIKGQNFDFSDAVVQTPQGFSGGGLPMDIGVTGADPRLGSHFGVGPDFGSSGAPSAPPVPGVQRVSPTPAPAPPADPGAAPGMPDDGKNEALNALRVLGHGRGGSGGGRGGRAIMFGL